MTDLENIREAISKLKSCSSEDIHKYFPTALNSQRFISKEEREQCIKDFYNWARENKAQEPLKFSYAEYLLAMLHFMIEDNEVSLHLLTKARKQFDELNDSEGCGLCAMLTGAIYRTFANFDLALKELWEAYNLLKQSGHYPVSLSACANSMANIDLEMHHYDEALEMFNITYEESKKAGDTYFNIYALHGLAKVNMLQNKSEEAKRFLEEALQLAKEGKSLLQISNSVTELANFYKQSGDLVRAEALDKEALAMREKHHFIGGAITNCTHLGEIYIMQAKWEEALEVLNKGLALAEQLKVKPKLYQVHYLISEMYHKKNDPVKCLHHFKIFHQLREQVVQEDSARKLADAKLIFEAEQTRKENIIIKKQKEEIQKKNIELQQTIDELTLTRVSRKAKALTLLLTIVLFIFEDPIIGFSLRALSSNNYFLSLGLKMAIIFSLSPINRAIESYLLKKVIQKKKLEGLIPAYETIVTAK